MKHIVCLLLFIYLLNLYSQVRNSGLRVTLVSGQGICSLALLTQSKLQTDPAGMRDLFYFLRVRPHRLIAVSQAQLMR